MSDLKQLGLLLWKNYTLQKRSLIGLFLEIVLPMLFAIILLPIRQIVKSEVYINDTTYKLFKVNYLPNLIVPPRPANSWFIGYTPANNAFLNETMTRVALKMSKIDFLNFTAIGFSTEEDMINTQSVANGTRALFGAITFLQPTSSDNKTLRYKIRLSYSPKSGFKNGNSNFWRTDQIYPLFPTLGPRSKSSDDGGTPGYFREGFLTLQNFIDTTYINLLGNLNNENLSDIISLKRFPYPPYNNDNFVFVISALFPFILMISYVFTVILTAKAIVYEKETGLKEAMKIMGMKTWVYWLSWYIKTFILLIPAITFITIAFKVKLNVDGGGKAAILNQTDPSILILFFLCYTSSSITFIFLISTFFKKANSAAAGAGVFWFLTYLPYIFIQQRYEQMSLGEKIAAAFLNNVGMSETIQLLGNFESKGTGIQWSNINEGVSVTDPLTFLQLLLINLSTSFIHLLLFAYFEQILPGDHGIAKKWYFPFKSITSFCQRKCSIGDINMINEGNFTKIETNNEFFENEDYFKKSRKAGIKIDRITKVFKQLGKLKTAVNNLSLNIYENHITVLLGHNGAGKSTTISMITGLASPNKGKILVNSYDIVRDTQNARKQIGFCPQHNLLFDDLTVAEHLKFFAKLKENYNSDEIDSILNALNLIDKKNARSKTLSGGMKRKLSVAIAFIGDSKIVILDEPTSGMDPQARHATWSVLQQFKKDRHCSILLTTHYLDEADCLGDRIAIMSRGQLKCCGSPMFLKSKYGSGYNLLLTRKTNIQNINDNITKITNLIKKHVKNAELNSNISTELSFVLPKEDASKFPGLFIELEAYKEELSIVNIGISVTTVEEVFLKIGDNELVSNEDMEQSKTKKETQKEKDEYGLWAGIKDEERNEKFLTKYFQQFYGLLIKKLIHSLRNKLLVIAQIIIPIGTLLMILILIKYGPVTANDSKALEISLAEYRQNYAPVDVIIKDSPINNVSDYYLAQFTDTQNAQGFKLNDSETIKNCTESRSSIDDFISCIGRKDLSLYTDNYIIGATFENNSLTGHFNNQPYHVPPLTLNYLTNSLLKSAMKSNDYKINVINHPLPRTLDDQFNDLTQLLNVGGFQIASTVTFGFSFLIASFITFLIKERVSNAKHMQYLNGASPIVFWSSTLVWDFINFLIPTIISVILILAFDVKNYVGSNIQYVIGLFIVYGLAHIPQTYLISYLFKKPATGFATNVAWNILASQITIVAVYFLQLPALGLADQGDLLEWIFLILLPNFAFGQSLTDLYTNYENNDFCLREQVIIPGLNSSYYKLCSGIFPTNPCCGVNCTASGSTTCLRWTRNYMDWSKPGLGRYFLFMPLQCIIQFSIVLLYELGYLRRIRYGLLKVFKNERKVINRDSEEGYDIPKDDDVIEEEKRIARLNPNKDKDDLLVTDNLTKYYSKFMAVRGISLGIKRGECFGLLGVNGAGKTTTFKMITGDEPITKGDVYLDRLSIKKDINKYQKQMGYCPQFDPLIDQMTVEETLRMFARLRGLKESIIQRTCESLILILDLSDHAKKMCYTLSGGNKRKLSVAISLIGSPKIVLLDEPTSGMDPKTRRYLWNCLENIREKGKSLILTSHSMEETEALCTRMCIMVNGELKCLGNLQHLKSKYGDGYTLLVKIIDLTKTQEFIDFVLNKINNSILKEDRDGFINIQINDNSTRILAQVFSLIEQNKTNYSIEYYLVTQTKLEQIFLNFASKQIDPSTRFLNAKRFICC